MWVSFVSGFVVQVDNVVVDTDPKIAGFERFARAWNPGANYAFPQVGVLSSRRGGAARQSTRRPTMLLV